MASDHGLDMYHYRYTAEELNELFYSRIFMHNIYKTGPLAANIAQPAEQLPIPTHQAVRMLDDADGHAQWTSQDALWHNARVGGHESPRLHPAAEAIDIILRRGDSRRPEWVQGISAVLLSAPAISMPPIEDVDNFDFDDQMFQHPAPVPDPTVWSPRALLPVPRPQSPPAANPQRSTADTIAAFAMGIQPSELIPDSSVDPKTSKQRGKSKGRATDFSTT